MGFALILLCELLIIVVLVASSWVIFTKAGRQGWEAIIPVYNTYVMTVIVGRPWWWLLLMFVPLVNLVIAFVLLVDLAKSFGKDIAYAIGMLLLPFIFFPMLAFGEATYMGPSATGAAAAPIG
jgi:hypothetical protein